MKKNAYVCITESLCCTAVVNTVNTVIQLYLYTLLHVKQLAESCCIAQGAQLGAVMTWRGGMGWVGGPQGKGCTHISAESDSLQYIAETNTL